MSRSLRASVRSAGTLRSAALPALLTLLAACGDDPSSSSRITAPSRLAPDDASAITVINLFPRRIVFSAGVPGVDLGIYTIKSDGTGLVQVTSGYNDITPTWSPNRAKIAFGRMFPGGIRKVVTMNANGTGLTELVEGYAPSWSPDGTKIAFQRHVGGAQPQIMTMNADGTNVQQLTSSPYGSVLPSWSPDGGKIAFTHTTGPGQSEVWVMNADGTNQHAVTDCASLGVTCVSAAWNPVAGDNRIAYSTIPRTAGSHQLRTIRSNGKNDTVVLTDASYVYNKLAVWSPNGDKLAFLSNVNGTTLGDIYTIGADGTGMQRVTTMPNGHHGHGW